MARSPRWNFESDPNKYREVVFKNAGFENFDRDGDGYFTVDDMKNMSKYYLDAVDAKDYEILDKWAQTAAGVSTPKGWFKDHCAQPPMWTFLSGLDMPIGLFQGRLDAAVPIAGVRAMEEQAKKAGKSKMEFFYFDNLDHTLGISSYFVNGKLPAGHKAIFDFIERQSKAADERR